MILDIINDLKNTRIDVFATELNFNEKLYFVFKPVDVEKASIKSDEFLIFKGVMSRTNKRLKLIKGMKIKFSIFFRSGYPKLLQALAEAKVLYDLSGDGVNDCLLELEFYKANKQVYCLSAKMYDGDLEI
jgi:hypothetical protein